MIAKILVVEDDLHLLTGIRDFLEFENYTVLIAENGMEGIEILKAETPLPDLILCDTMMPMMDGYTFLQTIRNERAWKSIPVIFLGSKSEVANKQQGISLDVEDYIPKPFEPEDLLSLIQNPRRFSVPNRHEFDRATYEWSVEQSEAVKISDSGSLFSIAVPIEIEKSIWKPFYAYITQEPAHSKLAAGVLRLPVGFNHQVVQSDMNLSEDTQITVIPQIVGFQFNPASITIGFYEECQQVEFKIRAKDLAAACYAFGTVLFIVENKTIAQLPVSIYLTEIKNAQTSISISEVQALLKRPNDEMLSQSKTAIINPRIDSTVDEQVVETSTQPQTNPMSGSETEQLPSKVLLVDDEVGSLKIITIMLQRAGFEVLEASSSQVALDLLTVKIPNMIIVDAMMPSPDGIELCQLLRKRATTKNIPILLLTSRGDADTVIHGMEAGANDYLPKPILHEQLISKVKTLLSARYSASESVSDFLGASKQFTQTFIETSETSATPSSPSKETTKSELLVNTQPQILIVDDDNAVRYSVNKTLQRIGYAVSEASSGVEALNMLKAQEFDVVLTDIHMPPGLDGIELVKRINEEAPDVPVILLTNYVNLNKAVEALQLGAYDYLVKPCSSHEIRQCVKHGVERSRSLKQHRKTGVTGIPNDESRPEAKMAKDIFDINQPEVPLQEGASTTAKTVVTLGALTIYPEHYQIFIEDKPLDCTPTELDLLLYLIRHGERVVPYQELVQEVRGYTVDEGEAREVIRPHLSNLRRKLRAAGQKCDWIVIERGIGCRINDECAK